MTSYSPMTAIFVIVTAAATTSQVGSRACSAVRNSCALICRRALHERVRTMAKTRNGHTRETWPSSHIALISIRETSRDPVDFAAVGRKDSCSTGEGFRGLDITPSHASVRARTLGGRSAQESQRSLLLFEPDRYFK